MPDMSNFRRFFRFRLTSLLIFTTLCCFAMVWRGHVRSKFSVQQTALARLIEDGASVQQSVKQPKWLATFIGRDLYLEVAEIRLDDQRRVDLSPMAALTSCQQLHISSCPCTDDDLLHVRHLTDMRRLSLINTKVTNKGLEILNGLTSLEAIDLAESNIDDEGIAHLITKKNLTYVRLDRHVTKKGLGYLAELPKLQHLSLYTARVSPDSLAILNNPQLHTIEFSSLPFARVDLPALLKLPHLRHVKFWHLTDEDIRAIAKQWPELESIGSVGESQLITNDCIASLFQLKNLTSIDLENTRLSTQAIASIKRAFPSANINITKRTPGIPISLDRELNHMLVRGDYMSDTDYEKAVALAAGTESLYFQHMDCDKAALGNFAGYKDLTSAWSSDCAVRGPAFDEFHELPNLRFLKFTRAAFDEDAIRSVSELSHLNQLEFVDCRLPENAIELLSHSGSLRDLAIGAQSTRRFSSLSEQQLEDLALMTQLKSLSLANSDFGDDDCDVLLSLHNLEKLDLRGTLVGFEGTNKLKSMTNLRVY